MENVKSVFILRCGGDVFVCLGGSEKGRRADIRQTALTLFSQTELSVLGSSVCLCSSHISHQDTDSNKHSHAGKSVCGSSCVW